jgi:hypothetical protein
MMDRETRDAMSMLAQPGRRFDVYQLDRDGRYLRRIALVAPDRGHAIATAADLVDLFGAGGRATVEPPRAVARMARGWPA